MLFLLISVITILPNGYYLLNILSYTENFFIYIYIAMIPKEDSYNSMTCLDTSISDPIFNASVSTSTPLKQKESFSIACKFL